MTEIVKLKDLKLVMSHVRDRWKVQGLDVNVFFKEVLMNLDSFEFRKEKKNE